MKVSIYGKVVARSCRKTDKGDMYSIIVEEPGKYPSRFQLSSRDATLFGQPDGPFGVGSYVTATAFVNGREEEAKRRDGKSFKAYRVWFTLTKLESGAVSNAAAGEIADDTPF